MSSSDDQRARAGRHLLDEGIARLALLALAERDVQQLLGLAVHTVADALGASHTRVLELLPDGSTLVLRASLGDDPAARRRLGAERLESSQASYTLEQASPVVSDDVAHESRFRPSREQVALGITTSVSVPLLSRTPRPYGVLEVGTNGRFAVSLDAVQDFLLSAGSLLVPAVERARLEAACRFLAESHPRLVSADDFRGSVTALAEVAVPQLADWCCIDVLLPTGMIECSAVAHIDARIASNVGDLRLRLEPDPSAAGGVVQVVRTGVSEFHTGLGPALSVERGQDRTVAELAELAGFREAIVSPLTARGHPFGAVTLVARESRRPFDQGDVLLADTFAAHAGLVLDDVRLFGQGHDFGALSHIAGVTAGIGLLDSEILGTRLVRAVAEERDRVTRIVEDVVLAHRLAAVEARPDASSSDVVLVVRRVVEKLRGSVPDRWTLRLEQPAIHAVGDADTLQRIVACLIDNAVRYSPHGGMIRVRVNVEASRARIVVEDSGVGVPASERELVFEKFRRGKGARELAADGAGLGLYICRELVASLGGRIEIHSNGRHGTTVVVELPLAEPPTTSAGSGSGHAPDVSSMTVA